MPTTSTGTAGPAIVAQCSVPAAGEFVTGAGLKTAIDPINDDLATIKEGDHVFDGNKEFAGVVEFSGGITGPVQTDSDVIALSYGFSPAVTLTRTGCAQPVNQSGSWAMQSSGLWVDTSTGGVLRIPVDVPHGATLNTVRAWIDPAAGHAGVPSVTIILTRRALATNADSTPTQAGGTETSANPTAFQAPHALTLTLTSGHVVDRSAYVYHVTLTGETGGLAAANLAYLGIDYTYSVANVGRD